MKKTPKRQLPSAVDKFLPPSIKKELPCLIAGVDEVGKGAIAGPVVSCACIVPQDILIPGDSKQLSPKQREHWLKKLEENDNVFFSVGIVHSEVIDDRGITRATDQAMVEAVRTLTPFPRFLLVDGKRSVVGFYTGVPAKGIPKGDSLVNAIAAASIIAKVKRDALMAELNEQWPQYEFDKHKGYPTASHYLAIEKYGPCPFHRKTFRLARSTS